MRLNYLTEDFETPSCKSNLSNTEESRDSFVDNVNGSVLRKNNCQSISSIIDCQDETTVDSAISITYNDERSVSVPITENGEISNSQHPSCEPQSTNDLCSSDNTDSLASRNYLKISKKFDIIQKEFSPSK